MRAHGASAGGPASSVLGVDLLDEARELVRSRADRAERLLVVHPQRAEQAHRAERLVREAVGRADERELVEARGLQLVAHARERAAQLERLREHVEQRGALIERVDEAAVRADLLRAEVVEEPGGAADVELALVLDGFEDAADRAEERALSRRELGRLERAPEQARAEPH